MKGAARSKYLAVSPYEGIDLPRIDSHEMRFLSRDEVGVLADAIHPLYNVLVLTAAYTGLRWGELAGLKVKYLNLLRRSLLVEEALTDVKGQVSIGPVKTRASRRTVSLPPFIVELVAAHLARNPKSELVFTAAEGAPLRASNFRRRFWNPSVEASVGSPMRFHDLRHTHAALLIAENTNPKTIQVRLGHASIKTTLDTYGHLMESLDEAAANALDAAWAKRETGQRRDADVL